MKSLFYSILATCALAIPSVGFAETISTTQEPSTKKSFPSEITIQSNASEYKLQLTGVAVRKKFIVNVYALGHYIEGPITGTETQVFETILDDNKPKQLTFDWAYNVPSKQVQDSYRESFHKVLSDSDYKNLQGDIEKFLSFYNEDVKINDKHFIRWLPGNNIEVIVKGTSKGSINNNPAFAKALWSIWLGPKSVVNREKLVALVEQGK